MTRSRVVLGVLMAFGMAGYAAAQAKPTVGRYYIQKPKAGNQQQYEAGRKKHMAFHKKADKWTWFTWEIITGPEMGSYLMGTPGHAWKDFDGRGKLDAEDKTDATANVNPVTEATRSSFWVYRPDLSLSPEGKEPAKYTQVIHFYVKAEGVGAFTDAIRKINEGLKKTNAAMGNTRWYVMANGDDGPLFALVQERNTWAEFEGPEKSLDELMADAFGKEVTESLMKSARSSYWHTRSFIAQYRPELSSVPESK